MRRQLLLVILVAGAMAFGTWWLGWWAVPLLGAGWGSARYGRYPHATAAAAAALGWVALLGVNALGGPQGELSRMVAGALGTPGWVPLLLVVAFPAVLALAAARLGALVASHIG